MLYCYGATQMLYAYNYKATCRGGYGSDQHAGRSGTRPLEARLIARYGREILFQDRPDTNSSI